jgi:hypothetical protein
MKRANSIPKPGKEIVLEAAKLNNAEARFLVSNYYDAQDARKREDMQLRHLGDNAEQHSTRLLEWTANANAEIEKAVLRALGKFAEASPVGRWMLAQHGVGPVIAAGILAHIDIEQAPTAGHIWSFAGLNPERKWMKGEKRPYNAALKQLTFHIGECFKRSSGSPDSIYGRLYQQRKAYVVAKNERGDNAERAKTFRTNSKEVRAVLATGKLPAGNLDRQAANYAAKIFLSHVHALMFWTRYGKAPPKPFAIGIMGHAHEIEIPMAEMFPGFADAYYGRKVKRAA